MDASLVKTPLYDWHCDHGGRLVDFAGWAMPVQYSSISEEHLATRRAATLFDVSHMGRFQIVGPDAAKSLDRILTRRIDNLAWGRIRYSLVTAEDGGVLDDVLVYHLPFSDHDGYSLVVNASNREKIRDWIQQQALPDGTRCVDVTEQTAMIAVQGPLARQLVIDVLQQPDFRQLKYYAGWAGRMKLPISGGDRRETVEVYLVCSRTGYTGEDGFELIVDARFAMPLWQRLWEAGQAMGVKAAGLGARDTLRLEAAMPLYGHELSEQINPIQAGLEFAVDLERRSFPGRDALAKAQRQTWPRRVGLVLEGKRVARQYAEVSNPQQHVVGSVTSGTFSPSLNHPIAMAYIEPLEAERLNDESEPQVGVDIRGKRAAATLRRLPFYRRPKKTKS